MVDPNEIRQERVEIVAAGVRAGVSDRLGDIWWSFLLRGVFALMLGIFALFWPTLSLSILVIGLAIYCIADGVAGLVFSFRTPGGRQYLAQALVSLGIGAVLLFWPEGSLRTLLILFGVWILFMGVSSQKSLNALYVVRMTMGDEDHIQILKGQGQLGKTLFNTVKKSVVPRVDEDSFSSEEEIGVAIVLSWVIPEEGIEMIVDFHGALQAALFLLLIVFS